MAVQIIDGRPYRVDAALERSRAISQGVRDTAFLMAHEINQYNEQLEKDKHTKLATIGMLAGKYGFSKLGPDITQEFERLSGVKFARDEYGKPVIPQTDDERIMAQASTLMDKLPPERKQEIILGMADMTSKPKSQSEIDLANRKMDLQSRHNDQIEAIDAARVQASLNRGTRGGGNSPDALQTINSQFMRNPDDPEKGIPVKWDGKSPPMSQLEFNNFFKNRNLDKVQDDINRKHLLDGLRENKQELDRAKNAAAIIGNSKIKEDDPAKIAAHAYLDSVAKVKFGVEAPKKQTWKEWASDIVGLKPTPEAVTQSKAIAHPYQPQTMAPTHTQEEWDSTVKQYLDAGVSGEDILDHAQNDPMAVQALINNGAGVKK